MQLIASSLIVAALTVVLIELTILVIVLLTEDPQDDLLINEQLGRQAQVAAAELAETPAATQLTDGALSGAERETLERELDRYVQSGVPIRPGEPPASLGDAPSAAILDARGAVVASTMPTWAMPGGPFTNIDFAPARTVIARALYLRGGDTEFENTYVLDYLDDTMAAAQPIMVDGELVGVILFQADGGVDAHEQSLLWFLLRASIGNVLIFGALAVPVLLVAVPIGIFRARRISRRLEQLSDATTAMARGDLSQRVDVVGEDEVARVGQRFNEMVAQLEQADRSRRAFVSNVSHELRTPIAILQGNLEQLLARIQRAPEDAIDAKTLEAMHQETITLARLIDDLFTLARIEEAVLQVDAAPVDLAACIRRAVDGIAPLAWEQRRVSVDALLDAGVPPVMGEQTRIQQILSNLLYNALRHTPEGGLIVAAAERDGAQVAVTISDTGLGIPPEELEHVFDRYYQVERAGRHGEGSGLGLAIVKQLVEAMDGSITVESELNRGTTFRIVFPAAQ